MEISLSLVIGYKRRRPDTAGDRLEARLDSIGLLVVGSLVTVIILWFLVPRILAAFGFS